MDHGGDPQPGAHSLDAPGALGLVLHYLNSTMHKISLQQIFALISHYITLSLPVLLATLCNMEDAKIKWFNHLAQFEECIRLIVAQHPCLNGAFASIDGLNLAVQTSDDEDIKCNFQ